MTDHQFETQVRKVLPGLSKSAREKLIKTLKKEHPDRINQIIKIAKDYE
jgi:hypothetical protein